MDTLIALLCFALSLAGCDIGGTHLVHRSSIDGIDALYSKVDIRPGLASFHCLRSASGRCHYTLFPRECVEAPTATARRGTCVPQPPQRFAVSAGSDRELTGLPGFDLCVRTDALPTRPGCMVR
jgi:hypothetical protein